MPGSLAIAQVTPFAWEAANEVNEYVARVSEELARRGHRVLVIAPSESSALVRDTRRALRGSPEELLERADGAPAVLGVGEVLPFSPTQRRAASLPVDVARTIEDALSSLALDVVHVHEPFAPSASSSALRHSRALNVGSFHAPTERILSTQLAGPLSRLLFGRLDARTASYEATRELLQRFFPGEYRVILPAADVPPAEPDPEHLVMIAREERAALRTFLRALRLLPIELEWRATVWATRPLAAPATLGRVLRERVRFLDAGQMSEAEALHSAGAVALASEGIRTTPGTLLHALAARAVPVASRLPAYEELLAEGRRGLVFEPGDAQTLAAQLERLLREPELGERLRESADALRASLQWPRVADELEEVYADLVGRRHDGRADTAARRRLAGRPLIDVDLHMHTDHSYDCATPVEVLLAEARERGLGAIAITDHNEVSGALEARAKSDGVQVIVGEEVKTADQGEVIGLFIEQKIPRGMSLQETIAEIKRQGGLVYVPHPFDRLHSVPDYEHLLDVLDDVDAIEVFNPRVA
ncbi:MAG: glycosyltransferase, partial [Solirubrobacterales bacterium]|nr:glycosyltransferase [Solirubrobacterales bacterium]